MKYLLVFIPAIFFFTGCNVTDSSQESSPAIKVIVDNGVEYTLTISQSTFLLNDSLHIAFDVRNNSTAAKTFSFYNQQQLGFKLVNEFNKTAIDYPFAFQPALSAFTLQAGEEKKLKAFSLFKDRNENFIGKGKYILSAFLLDGNSPKLNLEILIK